MKNFYFIVSLMFLVFNSCGGDGSSGISNIASLPKATQAVSTSSSTSLIKAASTTGVKLKDWSGVSWGSSTSRAMCQSGVITKEVFRESSRPDKILCYMGVMESAGLFTASYDGTDKYYSLAQGGGSMLVKFNITKGSDGHISNFKMWNCEDGSTQSQYMSVVNSNGSITMKSVEIHSSEGFNFSTSCSVTGTHNGSGWTSKTMTVSHRGTGGSGGSAFDDSAWAQIAQGASTNTLSGFRTGSYGGLAFEESVYAIMQTLATDKVSTYAIGDGSAKFSGTFNGTAVTGAASWTGDTQAPLSPASSGDHFSAASSGTLPTASVQSVAFASDEIWDCSAGSSTFTTIDQNAFVSAESGIAACDAKFGGDSHNDFIDCHDGSGS